MRHLFTLKEIKAIKKENILFNFPCHLISKMKFNSKLILKVKRKSSVQKYYKTSHGDYLSSQLQQQMFA